MLKAIETETVTKNIIQEITRKCASKGINVTDNFAAYVIKLMVLNPEHGFVSDRPLARDDVQLLVDICVQKLSEEYSPSLATLQMQVYFDTNFATRHDIINENRANNKLRTIPLIKEIIDTYTKTKEDHEKLYRKIVVTTATISGLGNPTHLSVLREATAALLSVFPHTELRQFIAMSRKDKEQHITELTQITTGIRLFNRDCQKGGESIEDLPDLLQKAVAATQSSLESQLQKLLARADVLTTAVEKCVGNPEKLDRKFMHRVEVKEQAENEKTENEGNKDQAEKLHDISKKQVQMVLDGLITARQLEVYLRKLLMEVETSNQVLAELLDKLKLRLSSIHETVRFRTAIPTVQVYPQFIHLSQTWTSLQEEMVILSNINNLAWSLQKYLQVLEYIDEGVVKQMVGNTQVLTDEARLKATTGLKIDSTGIKCEVVYPAQVTDFDKLPLQYLGFCAWSLVEGLGALIPGNPNMGVYRWKGNYYAFSSPVTAAEFGQDPDKYVMSLLDLMRKKPELIDLLQLQEQLAAALMTTELPIKKPQPIIKRDREIQTELHPIPRNIDPTYRWNEWDLKRDAIKLANILKSKTKSVQTECSSQKMNTGLQAKPPKNQEVQTMQDRTFNVPSLQNYIYGLHRCTDDKQFAFTFTRPVHK